MKAHLVSSDDPVSLGLDVTANCGATVPNAYAVVMCETGGAFNISPLICCRKCYESNLSQRYIYGIIEGQKAKQMEVSE